MRYDLDLAIGVLNGTIGDYLKRRENGLALPMSLVAFGRPVPMRAASFSPAEGSPSPKVAVIVHGLMSTEAVFEMDDGDSYGAALARDFGLSPIHVRYNSGLHVSENGESLDAILEELVAVYPVPIEEIVLVGHSMGGLVIRSATHAASERNRAWLSLVKRAFYLGTPHLGAPLERFGNALTWALRVVGNPVTALIADVVNLRSSGVKDLRYANLRREDWEGLDADALLQNTRHPVPLLPEIRHHLIAATLSQDPRLSVLFGDALVMVDSATGRARHTDRCSPFPQRHVKILPGKSHLRLAHDPEVYAQIRAWLKEEE